MIIIIIWFWSVMAIDIIYIITCWQPSWSLSFETRTSLHSDSGHSLHSYHQHITRRLHLATLLVKLRYLYSYISAHAPELERPFYFWRNRIFHFRRHCMEDLPRISTSLSCAWMPIFWLFRPSMGWEIFFGLWIPHITQVIKDRQVWWLPQG